MNIQIDNKISDPKPTSTARTTSVTLSDGRTAVVRVGKGGDLVNAMRIADTPEEQYMVLAANVTTIDGHQLFYEEYLQMDLPDCNAILAAANQLMGNVPSPEQPS